MQNEDTSAGALAGIRVVDLAGTVATAYCGKLFRDLGASVTNLEPPDEGHPIRRLRPFHPQASGPEASALATWLSLGKRSVAAGPEDPVARGLLHGADLILDADPADERRLFEGQIRLSISWFGASGPYARRAATDPVISTHTAAARAIGPADGPPILATGHTPQVVAGTLAYVGAVGHLLARETGQLARPFHLDVSIFEAAMCITEPGPSGTLATGEIRPRIGINRFWPTYPVGIYPCRDGWLGVSTVTPSQWRSLCALLGLDELGTEPRYQVSINRLEDADAIDAAFGPRLLERTAREWVEAGQAARVPLALAPTPAELFDLEQFRDRGAWVKAEHPDQGSFVAPGAPYRLHRTPATPGGSAPRLGEHNGAAAAGDHGPAAQTPLDAGQPADRMPARGPAHRQAAHRQQTPRRTDLLQDIRIVDLTMGWAGPLATRQLADMGAEVIKVESCQYFDWWRGWESTPESIAQKLYEQSTAFNTTGRNKLGITLDLTSRRGVDLLLRLVAKADAVIENYTASVLPRLGLDYDRLRQVNPELVMVSMPPFGASGPWMNHRAYGSTVEQASGLPHLNGHDGDPPTMQHVALGDPIAGINGAAALLTALRHRRRTGEGQYVDLSHVQSMFPLAAHGLIEQAVRGAPPERAGGRHPQFAPWGVYPCIGAEPWITVTVETEDQWRALCDVLGMDAEDHGFADGPGRKRREDELDRALAARTTLHDGLALERRLAAAGVPAAVLRNTLDVLYDPHLEARGYWQWRERAYVGDQPNPSAPFRPASEDGPSRPYAVEWPAPTLGQHNREVLTRRLGLSEDELKVLERDKVIGTEPVV
ncbi:MAG: CoA transferase [Holophagales bacterium]|nr:CoA transferase [Holophagales bacterium]MYC11808.1 CoA transferase [Holophagales bacterium]